MNVSQRVAWTRRRTQPKNRGFPCIYKPLPGEVNSCEGWQRGGLLPRTTIEDNGTA